MKNIKYQLDKEIPLIKSVDVIVVGGGPGGLGAAVSAAGNGAKTLLIERYGQLGGMASVGEVHPFMVNHKDGVCLDKPVYKEWTEKMREYLPRKIRKKINENNDVLSNLQRSINKNTAALAAEDLCLQAGVELLYHHELVDVQTENSKIKNIILHSKSGFTAVKADVYVDCTGDGDLAAKAGCEFEMGDEDGNCQPMTLCFKLSGVSGTELESWDNKWRKAVQKLYAEAKKSGELSCPRDAVLMFDYYDKDIVHFNTTRVINHNATDGLSLSDAEIVARKQLREYLRWFRTAVPGFENAQLYSMGFHIGVRETRRIKGMNYLTRQDFINKSKFEDAVARCNYPIDIHSPTGGDTELVHLKPNEFYEIPYGCIVSKDINNLTIGGRPISVDVAIHSSMRVMPPACSVGQAAGLSASEASKNKLNPVELDGKIIRQKLKNAGAFL